MNSVFMITKYIIKKLQNYSYTCSKVKIMKILYFVKGHYYQEKHEPLFEEHFEAWINGPVVRSVYAKLTYEYNWAYTYESVTNEEVKEMDEEIKAFVDKIVFLYGKFNDETLIETTHQEKPWKDARGNLSASSSSENLIDEVIFKTFYEKIGRTPIKDLEGKETYKFI